MFCNICGSNNVSLVSKVKERDIYECWNCETQFVYPIVERKVGDYVANNLNNPYYGWITFYRQSRIIKGIVKQGKILDYGCGGGHFLTHMGKDWDKYGMEIHPQARQVAQDKGIVLIPYLIDDDYKDTFDVVTMFAVIEHLYSPKETIAGLSKTLKTRGLFVIMTGDVNSPKAISKGYHWHMYQTPEHLYFFPAKTIDKMMQELGYKKIKSIYTDGGMLKIPFIDKVKLFSPLFDHYYGYYIKG